MPLSRAGDSAAEQRLIQMCHLDKLVFDMRSLLRSVVFRCQRRRTDDHVSDAHLAAAVALPVISGKPLHHHARKLIFSGHEHIFIGNEHIVEDNQRLLPAKPAVSHIDGAGILQFPGIAGLTAVYHEQSLRIAGAGKGNRVIRIRLPHGDGWHDQVPVGIDRTGLMCLGSAHHDSVRPPLHDPQEQIFVRLRVGRFSPVTLGVRHRAVHHQILVLDHLQELHKVLVIFCSLRLVQLIGRGEHRVKRVHPHTALKTCARLLSQKPLHLHLADQIVRALVQMGEPVDRLAGQGGFRGHQIRILRVLRQIVGHRNAVDGRADNRMIHPVLHLLAEHVHPGLQPAQTFNILFSCH